MGDYWWQTYMLNMAIVLLQHRWLKVTSTQRRQLLGTSSEIESKKNSNLQQKTTVLQVQCLGSVWEIVTFCADVDESLRHRMKYLRWSFADSEASSRRSKFVTKYAEAKMMDWNLTPNPKLNITTVMCQRGEHTRVFTAPRFLFLYQHHTTRILHVKVRQQNDTTTITEFQTTLTNNHTMAQASCERPKPYGPFKYTHIAT